MLYVYLEQTAERKVYEKAINIQIYAMARQHILYKPKKCDEVKKKDHAHHGLHCYQILISIMFGNQSNKSPKNKIQKNSEKCRNGQKPKKQEKKKRKELGSKLTLSLEPDIDRIYSSCCNNNSQRASTMRTFLFTVHLSTVQLFMYVLHYPFILL